MRTRSSSNLIVESFKIQKRRNRRRSKQIVEPELQTIIETPVATMADIRTMLELLQAPTEGYEDAIDIPAILAITSTLKYKNVPHDAIKLMLFPFSLEGQPGLGLKKNPLILSIHGKISFLTQDSLNATAGGNLLNRTPRDALTIIENKSKVRTSRNKPVVSKVNTTSCSSSLSPDVIALTEIIKELVLMNKATQQATVKSIKETCVTCGGPRPYYECLATDSNTLNASAATGTYNQGCNGYRPQGDLNYCASNQMGPPRRGQNFNQGNNNYHNPNYQAQFRPLNELSNYMKTNEATLRAMQTQMTNMKTELRNEFKSSLETKTNKIENQNNQIMSMLTNLMMQKQSPLGLGSLPSNTVANPRGDVKAITTQSSVAYDGPTILPTSSPLPKEIEHETEAKNDKRLHFDISLTDALLYMPKFGSTFKSLLSNKEELFELASTLINENCSAVLLKKLPEKLGDPEKFLIPCDFSELEEFLALADLDASINLMPLSVWKKLYILELTPTRMTIELANRSEYAQEVLGFSYSLTSGNPTPLDPIIAFSSPSFTPLEGGDFILEEIETFLRTPDELSNLDDDYYYTEGDILYLEKLLNEDPSSNLPPMKNDDLKQVDVTIMKPSIKEPPELELKDLPSHLEYAFLEGANKLPVIFSKELNDEE
nr:reverse transcriptase domain-containing protein [Tanacetum cinerariifolium]